MQKGFKDTQGYRRSVRCERGYKRGLRSAQGVEVGDGRRVQGVWGGRTKGMKNQFRGMQKEFRERHKGGEEWV